MSTSPIAEARHQALGDLPRRTANRFPDKLAVVDGDTRLTFAELDAVISRTAAALDAAGMAKGDRLALLSHNCWEFVVLGFATARLGVLLVPINFMLGPDEIAYILDHSESSALVVEEALVKTAEAAMKSAGSDSVRLTAVIGSGEAGGRVAGDRWVDVTEWFEHEGEPPRVLVEDDDPLRLMYTSGTE